jgi:hypothetical protein
MSEPQITCPHCRTEIKLTESLAAPLIAETRKVFEAQLARKELDFGKREASLRQSQQDVTRAREAIDDEVSKRLRTERSAIAVAEAAKARLAVASDLEQRDRQVAELRQNLTDNDSKLAVAQRAQVDVIRKSRELDDARRELDLSVEAKVQQSLSAVREKAKLDAEEGLKLRLADKEHQIAGMQRKIEDLLRKSEQGSQQAQGEVTEIELQSELRARFPRDLIEPVAKGEFGGDVLHHVIGASGQSCGTILWESKRTKAWQDGWLVKLRDDQRVAKADVALIVSSALPKNVETFDLLDNVWVAKPRFAIPLAIALRQSLIDVAGSRLTQQGQQSKMALIYSYLTGPQFRLRIDAIVEKFTEMREDLDRERKALTKLWARREEQLKCVLDSTAGLYGDLQGIAGRAMPEIGSLDVLMIDSESSPDGAYSVVANASASRNQEVSSQSFHRAKKT